MGKLNPDLAALAIDPDPLAKPPPLAGANLKPPVTTPETHPLTHGKRGNVGARGSKSRKTTPRLSIHRVEEALRNSAGIVLAAANILGCSPTTVRAHVAKHKRLQRVITEIEEDTCDLAESQLLKAIGAGDLKAVIFYLKTKGKRRGFSEKSEIEVTGKGGGPVRVIDLTDYSTEQLEKLAAELIDEAAAAAD